MQILTTMDTRTSTFRVGMTPEVFNGRSVGHLPGLIGLSILTLTK